MVIVGVDPVACRDCPRLLGTHITLHRNVTADGTLQHFGSRAVDLPRCRP
jgi:hypothetical protein